MPLLFFALIGVLVGIKRPYARPYNNARVVANMTVCVAVESVYLWYRTASAETKHTSQMAFYLPLVVCVLLLLAVIYNSIALAYQIFVSFKSLGDKKKLEGEEKSTLESDYKEGFMEMMKMKKVEA